MRVDVDAVAAEPEVGQRVREKEEVRVVAELEGDEDLRRGRARGREERREGPREGRVVRRAEQAVRDDDRREGRREQRDAVRQGPVPVEGQEIERVRVVQGPPAGRGVDLDVAPRRRQHGGDVREHDVPARGEGREARRGRGAAAELEQAAAARPAAREPLGDHDLREPERAARVAVAEHALLLEDELEARRVHETIARRVVKRRREHRGPRARLAGQRLPQRVEGVERRVVIAVAVVRQLVVGRRRARRAPVALVVLAPRQRQHAAAGGAAVFLQLGSHASLCEFFRAGRLGRGARAGAHEAGAEAAVARALAKSASPTRQAPS